MFFLSVRNVPSPHNIAVNRYDEIINVYREIGIQPFAEIDPHGYGGHDYGGEPQAGAGMIFPPQIEQTCDESEYFKQGVEAHNQNFRVRDASTLIGVWDANPA